MKAQEEKNISIGSLRGFLSKQVLFLAYQIAQQKASRPNIYT
jgi:hypothetical protein